MLDNFYRIILLLVDDQIAYSKFSYIIRIITKVGFQELFFVQIDQSVEKILLCPIFEPIRVNLRQLTKDHLTIEHCFVVRIV